MKIVKPLLRFAAMVLLGAIALYPLNLWMQRDEPTTPATSQPIERLSILNSEAEQIADNIKSLNAKEIKAEVDEDGYVVISIERLSDYETFVLDLKQAEALSDWMNEVFR